MFDGLQDTDGGTQTSESHHTITYLNITGSQLSKFFRQDFFQAMKGFGNQLEFFLHKGMIIT